MPATDRPTLVLVTLDTLNERHLGFFGYPHATSPELDAFLTRSVVFEEAQTAAPWTLPSVASVLTGLPFSAHGAGHVRRRTGADYTPVRSDVPLLAEILRDAGYVTTAIVANPYFDPRRGIGLERGFDHYFVFDGKERDLATREALARVEDFGSLGTVGFRGEGTADRIVEVFERVLTTERRRGAFFWLHFLDLHNPYRQRNDVIRAAGHEPPPTRNGSWWLDAELRNAMKAGRGELGARERRDLVRVYDGELRFLDAALGRLFSRFDAAFDDDAWLVLTSDHGEELWEHGAVDHDHTMYQELVGSFVALHRRGLVPRRDPALVSHADVFATLCGLAGVACPAPPPAAAPFAGRDLRGPLPEAPAFSENNLTNPLQLAVRTGSEKAILQLASDRYELYDLANDPGERFPLRDDARHRELRALAARLRALRAEPTGALVVDPALAQRLRSLGYAE